MFKSFTQFLRQLIIGRAARRFSALHSPLDGYETTIKIFRADKHISTKKWDKWKKSKIITKKRTKLTLVLEEGVPELSKRQEMKKKRRAEAGLEPEMDAIAVCPTITFNYNLIKI